MEVTPACPVCQQNNEVYRVSDLYVAGITTAANRTERDQQLLRAVSRQAAPSEAYIQALAERFHPPLGQSEPMRRINPDFWGFAISAVIVVIIYNTFWEHRTIFLAAFGLWILAGLVYFVIRSRLKSHFYREKERTEQIRRKQDEAVLHWSRTYYCAEDEVIFEPGREDTGRLDGLEEYVSQKGGLPSL